MSTDIKSQLGQKLTTTKAALVNLLEALTDEQWQTVVVGEGNDWTVLDMTAHLIESEASLSDRIERIRQGKSTLSPGFDLDAWNAELTERIGQSRPTVESLMQQLDEVREKVVAQLATVEDHEWHLPAHHPTWGEVTLAQYFEIISGHQQLHTSDIQKGLGQD